MKYVLIGDTHFGARSDNLAFHKYFRRFYEEVFFPWIDRHREEVNRIIHVGDIFDQRKFISYPGYALAKSYFFDPLQKRGLQMDLILGNHDVAFNNTLEINSPELLLKEYDVISVIREPVENLFLGDKVWLDHSMLYLPWICPENLDRSLKAIDEADHNCKVLIAHLDINGFDLGGGRLCSHGFDPGMFNKFDLVLTGHYHKKQEYGNIRYLGAPYEMSWSDYNQPKGFHVLDGETLKLEYHRNPFRMFHRIIYDDRHLPEQNLSAYANTYVKVVVAHRTRPNDFDLFIESLHEQNPADLVVEDRPPSIDLNEELAGEHSQLTLDLVRDYVRNTGVPVDKEELTSFLTDLYHEATSMDVD